MEQKKESNAEDTPSAKRGAKGILASVGGFIATSTNGMGVGLFATTIIATLILALAKIPQIASAITVWGQAVNALMGAGIGLGVALALKKNPIEAVTGMSCGVIGCYEYDWFSKKVTLINDPLSAYFGVLVGLWAVALVMRKKTPVDLILVPLVGILSAILYSYLLAQWVHYVTLGVVELIRLSSNASPILMCILISVVMSIAISAPISSVAICLAVNIQAILTPADNGLSIASGAALIGTCTAMVGLGVESIYDNGWVRSLAVLIGTPKLQFPNLIRKPLAWLPSIIGSAILGPFAYVCQITVDSVGAGMGTCGLIGVLNAYLYAPVTWQRGIYIPLFTLVIPAILVFAIDWVFRKCHWIQKGDLTLKPVV